VNAALQHAANEPFQNDILDVLARFDARLARIESALDLTQPKPAPAPSVTPPTMFCTIPVASKVTSIGVETLRAWVASGRLPRRMKGAAKNPKRPTFLVSIEEVRAAAEMRWRR
jgi:hypothetical protein